MQLAKRSDSVQLTELLERAREYVISSIAVDDSATRIATINMAYGLAKIHWVQQTFGYPADAIFTGASDISTTRYPLK
jgi:hypothetical protein